MQQFQDLSQKAPEGFKWADQNDRSKGVIAIEGGPGTHISSEVAGRVGMANVFLRDVPSIKKNVADGLVTGTNFIVAKTGRGEQGQTLRQIQSGTDALLRTLTGAGMPQTEAEKYVARYEPNIQDTAEVVGKKMEQLEKELRSIEETIMRGRRAAPQGVSDGWSTLPGGVKIREKK